MLRVAMRNAVLALLVIFASCCTAQSLTVKLIDEGTGRPVRNALVRLHYGCEHSMRPIELIERTDATGNAIFTSVSLSQYEFCVFPDYKFDSQERQFLFVPPSTAGEYSKYLGKVFTALPAAVTFHVRRLTVGERFRNFLILTFKS